MRHPKSHIVQTVTRLVTTIEGQFNSTHQVILQAIVPTEFKDMAHMASYQRYMVTGFRMENASCAEDLAEILVSSICDFAINT